MIQTEAGRRSRFEGKMPWLSPAPSFTRDHLRRTSAETDLHDCAQAAVTTPAFSGPAVFRPGCSIGIMASPARSGSAVLPVGYVPSRCRRRYRRYRRNRRNRPRRTESETLPDGPGPCDTGFHPPPSGCRAGIESYHSRSGEPGDSGLNSFGRMFSSCMNPMRFRRCLFRNVWV